MSGENPDVFIMNPKPIGTLGYLMDVFFRTDIDSRTVSIGIPIGDLEG